MECQHKLQATSGKHTQHTQLVGNYSYMRNPLSFIALPPLPLRDHSTGGHPVVVPGREVPVQKEGLLRFFSAQAQNGSSHSSHDSKTAVGPLSDSAVQPGPVFRQLSLSQVLQHGKATAHP